MTSSAPDSIQQTAPAATKNEPQLSPEQLAAQTIRFLSIDAVEKAKSGHPGAPMGLATIAVELFSHHLVFHPEDPSWPNRDRFILSCGHASMLLYSVLHLSGYDISLDDIKDFRQWGSVTPGHPEFAMTPGVETTTGPLGQGVGNAVGMALAAKMAGARVNTADSSVIDYNVYVLASDGDLMEGVAAEAASLAGHLELDNLVVIYDDNNITIDGQAELAFSEDVQRRFEGLGWWVERVDGHDAQQVRRAIERAKEVSKPSLIVARTKIGFGSPGKEGTSASHGAPLGPEEATATKQAAGWPTEQTFFVPEEAKRPFEERRRVNQVVYEAWQKRVNELGQTQKQALEALLDPKLPEDLYQQLLDAAGNSEGATRAHAGKIQQRVAELVPGLVGGSADLAGSVKTIIKSSGNVGPGSFGERNLHFGVREHGMGAILNGLALSGMFLPYGSTFLIFGDYMRPPMRLASLMSQQVLYVFSHDSVYLGEDGPTHQPVEQLWTMRMVPNFDVVRPADAMECAAAWTYALRRGKGPTALSLTRHVVPELRRSADFDPQVILDGGYVLQDAQQPELVLIATGSEVSVAQHAADLLAEKGRRVRVVSMPCVEQFLRLPAERQAEILPPGVRRASLELGITFPWRGLTGPDGICLGVDRFGVSAPWQRIQSEFGVTAAQVAERLARELD